MLASICIPPAVIWATAVFSKQIEFLVGLAGSGGNTAVVTVVGSATVVGVVSEVVGCVVMV